MFDLALMLAHIVKDALTNTQPPCSARWRRPLLIGGTGQLGSVLTAALRTDPASQPLRTARSGDGVDLHLDLAQLRDLSQAAALLDPLRPDLLLCTGAMTWVDGCERDPEAAFAANARGPSVLAAYAHARSLPFVTFSSDYVFAGRPDAPGPYLESDPPEPLNVYGESKLAGERAVLEACPQALILRTTWVYGPDRAGKNFISTLVRQLRARQQIQVPLDQVSTPTLNEDLAAVTLALLAKGASGLFHVSGPELISRFALAQRVARYFTLDEDLVQGVTTESLQQVARRPLHSGLRSERLPMLLPEWRPHALEEGLAHMAV